MRPHIVHISNDYDPVTGGINTHLKNISAALSEQGFRITLLIPTASGKQTTGITKTVIKETDPVTLVRSFHRESHFKGLKLYYLTKAVRNGLNWIRNHIGEIDLIHQHDRRATRLGAALWAARNDIPMICTHHSATYFQKSERLMMTLLKVLNRKPDGWITVHRPMADRLESSVPSDTPVRYIPNGVNPEHFTVGVKPVNGTQVVLFPQRIIPEKGADILAEAARTILSDYPHTNLSFWFAGSENRSNRSEESIAQVKEILGDFIDTPAVRFLGDPTYEEMSGYYREADMVVLSLQVETENISVFEAWASGTPLITTQQLEKNGYVQHEENCLTVPMRNAQSLSEAIIRLSADQKLRERLIKNGKKLAENRFTWEIAAQKTARLYREILNKEE